MQFKSLINKWTPGKRSGEAIPVLEIRPFRGWAGPNLHELWRYREVLYVFMWRDIKVRYKQTVIGAAWVVIQPLLTMLIFSIFFGLLLGVPSQGFPYPIFAFTALLPWQFFVKALTEASTSLVMNERVVSKVYFPRLLVPLAVVLAGLLDFAIGFVILLGLMLFFGISLSWTALAVPAFLLLAVLTASGVSFWLSALDVKYRDVRYTLVFLAQVWLFATPVIYPASIVPEAWRALYGLNPMVGVVEGFRWSLLGSVTPDIPMLIVSTVVIVVVFVGGVIYFNQTERTMADVI